MNRTKILFFCAGAVLAALLVWWLSAGERTPAGESGKRSPLDVIMTRTSIRAYRDCPVGADTVELLLRAAMAAPSAVVVCGDLSRNPGASGDWWVMDASAASENLLLAAHALGLGAVWTGVYPRGERVEAVRRVLGLPSDVVPLNLIPVGYPADNPEPKQKWNPANVRHNGWTE